MTLYAAIIWAEKKAEGDICFTVQPELLRKAHYTVEFIGPKLHIKPPEGNSVVL